jgi:hypothetical protein
MEMDRRSFLKGAAAFGAVSASAGLIACTPSETGSGATAPTTGGATAIDSQTVLTADSLDMKWSFEIPIDPVPDDQIVETYTNDIVVIGAGLSGLCTALSAQDAGADVRLFSASSLPVGRGGSNTFFGTHVQQELGIDFDKNSEWLSKLFKVQTVSGADLQNQKLWAKWRNNSKESFDFIWGILNGEYGMYCGLESAYYDPDNVLDCPQTTHNWYSADGSGGALGGAPIHAQNYADTFTKRGGEIDY